MPAKRSTSKKGTPGSTARSAKSGKFVTKGYAKSHPSTTVVSKRKKAK